MVIFACMACIYRDSNMRVLHSFTYEHLVLRGTLLKDFFLCNRIALLWYVSCSDSLWLLSDPGILLGLKYKFR